MSLVSLLTEPDPIASSSPRSALLRFRKAPWNPWRSLFFVNFGDGGFFARIEREVVGARGDELIIFADEIGLQPLFAVQQRTRPGAPTKVHEIFDTRSAKRLAMIRSWPLRDFFSSSARWEIFDGEGAPLGLIETKSNLVRRAFRLGGEDWFPLSLGGEPVALIATGRRGHGISIELLPTENPIDPHFILACALPVLLRLRGAR